MTQSLKIFVLIGLSFIACQSDKTQKNVEENFSNYENRFFTLNFEADNYEVDELRDHFFTTFPHNDPTLGDVVYDQSKWVNDDIVELKKNDGLYSYVKFRDDSLGFDSFRFTTKSFYNLNEETQKILFVLKGKLPSENGMWPAWWLNGSNEDTWTYRDSLPALTDESLQRYSYVGNYYDTPSSVNVTDWPSGGEIDIIENINGEDLIHNTIHTCPQMCDSEWNKDGVIINCSNAQPNDVNPGCSGKKYKVNNLEGTFACLWEQESIKFYYWEHGLDVKSAGGPLSLKPNPDIWKGDHLKNSVKLLDTDSECNNDLHQSWQCKNCSGSNKCTFQNMKMIFNVTLCGVWAGNVFDTTADSFYNCKEYIRAEGKKDIDNQFIKLEYISVKKL
jgi:hypothetical protein